MYGLGRFVAWLLDGAVGGLFFGESARPQKYAVASILTFAAIWLLTRGFILHSTWPSRLWSNSTKCGSVLAAWALAIVFFEHRGSGSRGN